MEVAVKKFVPVGVKDISSIKVMKQHRPCNLAKVQNN